MNERRVGIGIDVHKFVSGRELILGGIVIPHDKGLLGHSDADVLLHAIADALLGAASMGDIGKHFPDSDANMKNISSSIILKKVKQIILKQNFRVVNVDTMILAEKPKLAPYIGEMQRRISKLLDVQENCVSIKATTCEGMGFVGREEGISAHAVCMVEKFSETTND